jgi:uncharacterized protein
MEGKITYFDKPGKENTEATLRLVRERAAELGIKTVLVASTEGTTGAMAAHILSGLEVIVVSHSEGWKQPNKNELTEANRKIIESHGATILVTSHALGGVSRALRNRSGTHTIGDIMSHTLRVLGIGVKVCCEITVMAADCGVVPTGEDVIVVAGEYRGADTAVVLKPVCSHEFFSMRIREVICKPHF